MLELRHQGVGMVLLLVLKQVILLLSHIRSVQLLVAYASCGRLFILDVYVSLKLIALESDLLLVYLAICHHMHFFIYRSLSSETLTVIGRSAHYIIILHSALHCISRCEVLPERRRLLQICELWLVVVCIRDSWGRLYLRNHLLLYIGLFVVSRWRGAVEITKLISSHKEISLYIHKQFLRLLLIYFHLLLLLLKLFMLGAFSSLRGI